MKKAAGDPRKSVTTTRDNIQGKLLGANVKEISIEKFREAKYTPIPYKLNGKISEQILKTISNKFSAELIFNLDLSNQQLINIDSLQECKNLIMLNLSNNQIRDVFPLQHCTSITFLNLSFNELTACEMLKVMKQLSNLHLENNKLATTKSLKGLELCDNLNGLFLQSMSNKDQNPICSQANYRETVFATLPQLKRLDSIPKGMKLYTGEELDSQNKGNLNLDLNTPGSFYTASFPKATPFDKELKIDGEDSLKSSLKDCKSSISALEARIKALMA